MLWRPPGEDELGAFGLKASDYHEDDVEVWPENWDALDLYVENRTQMIVGAGGPVGLNYPWFWSRLDARGLVTDEADRIMSGLRVIERAVLDEAYKDR